MAYQAKDDFLMGVIVALQFVYRADQETLAEEILREVGPYSLLRVAKKNEDISLREIRRTIRFLRSQR